MKYLHAASRTSACVRMAKTAGKAIHRFSLVSPGEPILIGISGGKDSLTLALLLAMRNTWLQAPHPLNAVMLEWEQYPLDNHARGRLEVYFEDIGVELTIRRLPMDAESCYRCARNRKKILFEMASLSGCKTVAIGHHMDDVVETLLMNMATRGYIQTMAPLQKFFEGTIQVIRPLCLIKERTIANAAQALRLPVVDIGCPHKATNIRASFKPIISKLAHIDRRARDHMFNAAFPDDCTLE